MEEICTEWEEHKIAGYIYIYIYRERERERESSTSLYVPSGPTRPTQSSNRILRVGLPALRDSERE